MAAALTDYIVEKRERIASELRRRFVQREKLMADHVAWLDKHVGHVFVAKCDTTGAFLEIVSGNAVGHVDIKPGWPVLLLSSSIYNNAYVKTRFYSVKHGAVVGINLSPEEFNYFYTILKT